ncbi:MAG: crossover junction endodeoxyribonuclease RuvC [Deltaproteobacteria bacterium]|nr:crossover junction endodeoxyribonuclease RuvC [Deltaproteobacteria bacterium]
MRILGIDPGSITTGYGVVDNKKGKLFCVSDGSISTVKKSPLQERLSIVFDLLCNIIADYKPDAVAVEDIFFAKNVRSAIMLGQARGVALLCAGKANLPVFEYSPAKVKQSIVGYGNATKEQVQRMVKTLLKMPVIPKADAADALAVAICHIHHNGRQWARGNRR